MSRAQTELEAGEKSLAELIEQQKQVENEAEEVVTSSKEAEVRLQPHSHSSITLNRHMTLGLIDC